MTNDEILENELLDSIEFIGELDRIEGQDGELARVFKSDKRNNDTIAPTSVEKRNTVKDEIWQVLEAKAEEMADDRGISQELAVCKILDDNPQVYEKIRELTLASENRPVDLRWN